MQTPEEGELCFPKLYNLSCRKTTRPPSTSMLIYITLSSISLLTVTLNMLVIISISHFRKLHSPTNFLLLSLAVSDCMVGFLISFQIILIDGCWYLGDLMCAMYLVLDYVIASTSIGTMVLISVDRYVAICYPFFYFSKVTAERTKMCILLCWMCFILYQTLLLKENLQNPGRFKTCYGECVVFLNYFEGFLDLFFSFIGPITVIIVLYSRVFVVAVSQARSMRSQVAAVTLHGSVRFKAKKSEMKAAMILGVVVVVFLLCTCPYFCLTLTTQDTGVSASSVAFLLFDVNSTLNPLIYVLFYPWFRKSVKLILSLRILRPDSCNANIM
ncbi:trace amine-associated receptor 13c-like [Nothobranchius furzeri]|uniref:G-protein coupled receptors family 1 profile domain-containing protein n=1 Tax=Nothobranchius furzeri TaxID=105023 RepID=A0A8C6LHB1_NOTFU|nr:trace amine-associated receptor 13c-like [Nothobranchius furzeri]